MKQVINDLKKINGLEQAYIYREDEDDVSTFDAEKMPVLQSSAELIEQYFLAAEGIEKSYNEMIFPLDNGTSLITFLSENNTLVIALTKEKINLPMLHMAFTIIIRKLANGTYQQQAIRDAKEAKQATMTRKPTPERAVANTITRPAPTIPNPRIRASRAVATATPASSRTAETVLTSAKPTEAKNKASALKSLFSNPFTSKAKQDNDKKDKDERPYTLYRGQKIYRNETAKKPQTRPVEKKLVYRDHEE